MPSEATNLVAPADATAAETQKPSVEAPKPAVEAPKVEVAPAPKVSPALEAARNILAGKKAEKAPAEPEKEPEKEDSSRFAALTRRERQIVEERQKFAQEKAAYEKQAQELEQYRRAFADAKSNPLAVLEAAGVSVDDLASYLANGNTGDSQQARALKAEIEQLKKAQEEKFQTWEQKEAERQAQEQERVLEAFQAQVSDFVETNRDTYELTSLYQATPMVLQLIESTFMETGELLDTREAANLVEEHLEEQVEKVKATKKWQQKFAPVVKAPEQPIDPAQPAQPRTISNQLSATTPPVNGVHSSQEERLRRAVAAADAAAKAAAQ